MSSILSFVTPQRLAWAFLVFILIRLVVNRYYHGLSKFDGPFLASLTDFWRPIFIHWTRHNQTVLELHRKYGSVVRLGPNVLSFSEPEAVKDIYATKKHYMKSEFYRVAAATTKGRLAYTLFSTQDPVYHANLRRSVANAFSPTTVLEYEYLVDSTINTFLQELETRFADRQGAAGLIDFPDWFSYFAFDVMGDLSYSSRYGLIENGKDVNGMIEFVTYYLKRGYILGQMPLLNRLTYHNPVLLWLQKHDWGSSATFPGVGLALKHMQERGQKGSVATQKHKHMDLLDKFRQASKEHPDVMTDKEILSMSLSILVAGSEPTAATLSAIFYHLLKSPTCYAKLQEEIDLNFAFDISSPDRNIPYSEARDSPYLNACIQEAFRMHPALGVNIERVVPASGDTIAGHYVPGGTIVGCNPWVIGRDVAVFGDDVDTYRPERWLRDAGAVKEMTRTMFQFGGGNHVCLGKNIALLEIYKLVPSLMKRFQISLDNPKEEWTLTFGSVVGVSDFPVRIRKRAAKN